VRATSSVPTGLTAGTIGPPVASIAWPLVIAGAVGEVSEKFAAGMFVPPLAPL